MSLLAAAFISCSNDKNDYDASGIFETTEVIVSAKSAGELVRLGVEEGQTLKAGDVVGSIDANQLELKKTQLDANKKQLGSNKAATNSHVLDLEKQVAGIQQQIKNAQNEKARYQALLKDGAATRKQVDDIQYQISVLQKQLAATKEQIQASNQSFSSQSSGIDAQMQGVDAQKAQIDDQIANTLVKSPIDGTVLAKYAEQGEYAAPGKALFKVADIGNMKLRAYITAGQLTALKLGQKVKVYADQGEKGRKEYEGTVTWISDRAEFTPKTIQTRDERANLVYAIKIAVRNDGLIKRGMYGDVKF